jgi:predicted NAD-dependent protein-ADP-ribosyltransferase YbiA (DUF1768 family)
MSKENFQTLFERYLDVERTQSVAVEDIIPTDETQFASVGKLGLYPAEKCISIVTDKTTPYYLLDNMAVLDEPLHLEYQGETYLFNQVEQLFLTPRMKNPEAHKWLMEHLFFGRGKKGRVDGRLKKLYKTKREHVQRDDWETIQTEWMKAVLTVKYRQCRPFRELLHSTGDAILIEDATKTGYSSACYWGAKLVCHEGKNYFAGVNTMGKILMLLRDCKGQLTYSIPDDLHLFGIKFSEFAW